jgi:hypothetical protein
MTCFSCGKVGHVVCDCMKCKRQAINIMDTEEEPLEYPVAQGDRAHQLKASLNALSLEEKGQLANEMDLGQD